MQFVENPGGQTGEAVVPQVQILQGTQTAEVFRSKDSDAVIRKTQPGQSGQMLCGHFPAGRDSGDIHQFVPNLRCAVADTLRGCSGCRGRKQAGDPGQNQKNPAE